MYGEGKTRGQVSELAIEATINQAMAAIVVDGKRANREFVKLHLQGNYLQMRSLSEGGNQPNLNLSKIKTSRCIFHRSKVRNALSLVCRHLWLSPTPSNAASKPRQPAPTSSPSHPLQSLLRRAGSHRSGAGSAGRPHLRDGGGTAEAGHGVGLGCALHSEGTRTADRLELARCHRFCKSISARVFFRRGRSRFVRSFSSRVRRGCRSAAWVVATNAPHQESPVGSPIAHFDTRDGVEAVTAGHAAGRHSSQRISTSSAPWQ